MYVGFIFIRKDVTKYNSLTLNLLMFFGLFIIKRQVSMHVSYLRNLCLFAHGDVLHILCCVFVLFVFVLCAPCCQFLWIVHFWLQGRIQGGGAPGARPPKIGKNVISFCVKSWFFTRNTSTIFAPLSAIEKNMIFWRKIVIFHTKYPKNFVPPSARRNLFKCAPP